MLIQPISFQGRQRIAVIVWCILSNTLSIISGPIKTETSAEFWGSRYDKLEVERQNAAGDNEDVFPHFGILLTPSL